MRQLRISSDAAFDLDELAYHGTYKYGETQARRYYKAMQDEIAFLTQHPFIHPERDEVRPPIRLLAFGAHNIFYDVTDTEVVVVRVFHHSADWMNLL